MGSFFNRSLQFKQELIQGRVKVHVIQALESVMGRGAPGSPRQSHDGADPVPHARVVYGIVGAS